MNARLLMILRWIGTTAQVVGGFALAARVISPEAAFGIMLVGSVSWSIAAWAMRQWAMLALNAAFTLANLIGLWRWFVP
jgi:hypothetical protein